jgi:hypothetical protein
MPLPDAVRAPRQDHGGAAMSLADGRVFARIFGVPCAGGCGRVLPRLPDDDADPVVRAFGRFCPTCDARSEAARDMEV